MTESLEKWTRRILIGAAVLGFFVLFWRVLLPCLLPFLLAFGAAALLEPAVQGLCRKMHVKRGFASAVCVLFLLGAVSGVAVFAVSKLIYEVVDFLRALPELLSGLPDLFSQFERSAERVVRSAPEDTQEYLVGAMDSVLEQITELPGVLSAKALEWLSSLAGDAPKFFLFCATTLIGAFFVSAGFPEIRSFFLRQIPGRLQDRARKLKSDVLVTVGKWMRAQLTLMCVTFLELTAVFLLLHVRYAAVIAAITALIDALPVFGTGIVLLPWAAVSLISGETALGVGLLTTYLIVTFVRSVLEPKLLGSQFGIHPAAALLAMYSGFRLAGVAGMILFPPGLMVLKLLNDRGTVRLWKT